jgi:hypothetical protein
MRQEEPDKKMQFVLVETAVAERTPEKTPTLRRIPHVRQTEVRCTNAAGADPSGDLWVVTPQAARRLSVDMGC